LRKRIIQEAYVAIIKNEKKTNLSISLVSCLHKALALAFSTLIERYLDILFLLFDIPHIVKTKPEVTRPPPKACCRE
jgi:hypothetical protein